MTVKRNNVLSQVELCRLALKINEIKDDLMAKKPQCSEVAAKLSKELGFTITKHNLRNLITNGLCPDFRPPSESGKHLESVQKNQELKLAKEIEALRQIVEEQDVRINRLEVLLGASKLEERMNGKHSKVAM